MSIRAVVTAASMAAVVLGAGDAAFAACTKLVFSVNDYGKDGPTKDALSLLDKYVAKWTAERGIKKYTMGKKESSCELFLNFIVFDEHTCTASALVCWEGSSPAASPKEAGAEPTPLFNKAASTPPPPRPAAAPATAPISTGTVKTVAPAAVPRAPAAPAAASAVPSAVVLPPITAPAAVQLPVMPAPAPVAPAAAPVAAPGGN